MDQQLKLSLRLEFIWWIVTAIVIFGVLFPVFQKIESYPFLLINSFFVIIFITFTRYIFLLPHTFLAKRQVIKGVIVLTIIPFIFFLVSQLSNFQSYADEIGLESLMKGMSLEQQDNLISYIRSEMTFFGVGSIVASAILPIRLIISVWRNRNKGTA